MWHERRRSCPAPPKLVTSWIETLILKGRDGDPVDYDHTGRQLPWERDEPIIRGGPTSFGDTPITGTEAEVPARIHPQLCGLSRGRLGIGLDPGYFAHLVRRSKLNLTPAASQQTLDVHADGERLIKAAGHSTWGGMHHQVAHRQPKKPDIGVVAFTRERTEPCEDEVVPRTSSWQLVGEDGALIPQVLQESSRPVACVARQVGNPRMRRGTSYLPIGVPDEPLSTGRVQRDQRPAWPREQVCAAAAQPCVSPSSTPSRYLRDFKHRGHDHRKFIPIAANRLRCACSTIEPGRRT